MGLTDLIKKYQKTLGVNPSSRVFAPLAECYRRAGMQSEALEVLKEGIKRNPDYLLGYMGLAQCYYDMNQYQAGYTLIRPYVEGHKDNLKLQRIFASLCLKLSFHEEALDAYKYILFMNPSDGEAADFVAEFEDSVVEKKLAEKKKIETFPISKLTSQKYKPSDDEIDEWVAVDLSHYQRGAVNNEKISERDDQEKDEWTMEKPSLKVEDLEDAEAIDSPSRRENLEEEAQSERKFFVLEREKDKEEVQQPLITHTLVDLYCAQGHFEKAYNLLQKILELNPDDEKTQIKLKEVAEFLPDIEQTSEEESSFIEAPIIQETLADEAVSDEQSDENEEQAHERLMRLVESKVQRSQSFNREELENKLWLFHDKVKQKAKEKSLTGHN